MKRLTSAISALTLLLAAIPAPAQDWFRKFPLQETVGGFGPDTATVCILGDAMMHSGQISRAHFDESFKHTSPYLKKADVVIVNMEETFAGEPYSGYPCFSAPDAYARALSDAGANVFLMANNHILDKGEAGLERTIDLYGRMADEDGLMYTGIDGKVLYLRANNILLGIVNATYGTNAGGPSADRINRLTDRDLIKSMMTEAAQRADIVLALPHWGEEYVLTHNASQAGYARTFAELGADAVIGAHPHVVQDCENLKMQGKTVPVVYSLGNAVSNMSAENTQLGQMAVLTMVGDCVEGCRIVKVELIWLWCSRPGGYDDYYTVIPVEEFAGRRNEWKNAADYDRMMRHYNRRKQNEETYHPCGG